MVYDVCIFLSFLLRTRCFSTLISKLGLMKDDDDCNSSLHSAVMQVCMKGSSLVICTYFQYQAYVELITISNKLVTRNSDPVLPARVIKLKSLVLFLVIANSVLFLNIFVSKLIECHILKRSAEVEDLNELELKKQK